MERRDCWWGKAYQILLILKYQKSHSDCSKPQVSINYLEDNSVRRCDGETPSCVAMSLCRGLCSICCLLQVFQNFAWKKNKPINTTPPPPLPRDGCWGRHLRRRWCLDLKSSFTASKFVPSHSCCSKPNFSPSPACARRAAGAIAFKSAWIVPLTPPGWASPSLVLSNNFSCPPV